MSDNYNPKPLVSVIIPVYNGGKLLLEAVESIYKSTHQKFEIILVDDGSTDGSDCFCEGLQNRYKKVRFYNFDKNQGMTRVLNYAIARANGKYIARINQDDLMVPERLEWQVEFLENNPDHVAVGGFVRLFDTNKKGFETIRFPTKDKDLKKEWLLWSPFADPAVMYRRESWGKTKNGYNQFYWPGDDVHMWYQLGKLGKLANLPKIVTLVRWHNEAGSIKLHRLQMEKTWKLHMYAKDHVRKPTAFEWLFWSGQYLAGRIMPPRFNWYVYRLLRRFERGLRKYRKNKLKQIKTSINKA